VSKRQSNGRVAPFVPGVRSGLVLRGRSLDVEMTVGRLRCMDDASGRTSRVIRLARHLELARRDILAARDLDLWEYDVLAALRASGSPYEMSPGALIAQTQVSSGTMTNRIDRLDRRGYVTREPDADDHRGVRVRLTVSGRRKIDAGTADLAKNEHALWHGLGERKGAQLDVTVRDLLEQLD
jgi:DNA-binding MarR family transcriptional regulator